MRHAVGEREKQAALHRQLLTTPSTSPFLHRQLSVTFSTPAARRGRRAGGGGARSPLTTAEMESEAGMALTMTDMSLSEGLDGRMTGTGRNSVGELFQIEVARVGDRLRFRATYAYPDGRGSVSKEVTSPLPPGRS